MTAAKVGNPVYQTQRSLPLSFRHVAFSVHISDFALIVVTSVVSGCLYRLGTSGVAGEPGQFATHRRLGGEPHRRDRDRLRHERRR